MYTSYLCYMDLFCAVFIPTAGLGNSATSSLCSHLQNSDRRCELESSRIVNLK